MNWRTAFSILCVSATAGCSSMYPQENTAVQDRIQEELDRAANQRVGRPIPSAAPAQAASPEQLNQLLMPSIDSVTPRISSKTLDQRFDLSVTDAPIGQVLAGLVADTEYSMLIKPATRFSLPAAAGGSPAGAPGTAPADAAEKRITLNLKNVTLFEALDSIRDLYGFDYTVTGTRILVDPANIQTRLYQVNYVVGQRRGVSDLRVVGGASGGSSSGAGAGGGSSGGGYSSVQATGLSTTAKSDIWAEMEDALRTVLGCSIPRGTAASTGAVGATGAATGGAAGAGAGASRADTSHPGNVNVAERLRGIDGCAEGRALNTNQMSGTVLVRAMPQELRMVEQVLKSMQLTISRQVIIEAKIIDVELNKDSQQGINWANFHKGVHRFSVGANTNAIAVRQPSVEDPAPAGSLSGVTTLSGLLGAGLVGSANTAFSAGLGIAIDARNFSALINFLESQGKVYVLSSPRIATLNNQKAVLKVGSEEPFVTNIVAGTATTTPSGATPVVTKPTLSYQPFFSGIALDVTPQIDDADNITLHVHSMVNNIVERQKIALPDESTLVPFASNTINETDSVVRARDGQVIVIGGLMTEKTSDNRGGVPVIRDFPGLGGLFNKGAQIATKRELVILLKPTIVKDDSAWVDDINSVSGRIESMRRPIALPAQ